MRSRQRGATALGMLSIVAVLGFGLYGVIRLFPVYMEYMAVVRALEQTAKESAGNVSTPQSLRTSLDRRWTVEDITSLQPKDVEIKKTGSGFTMRAWYRAERPFIANVSLAVDFDKSVDVKGP
jgi:ribonuclease HI